MTDLAVSYSESPPVSFPGLSSRARLRGGIIGMNIEDNLADTLAFSDSYIIKTIGQ